MEKPEGKNMASRTVEMATFYVGKALCGMDILNVQEINKLMDMTTVPQSPDYVMGILNLRGQIVTIIDLGEKTQSRQNRIERHEQKYHC
jgi:purine-binding chemotaxis protein CheW